MKRVVVLRGIPGSGKSTFVESQSGPDDMVVASADHYFLDEFGVYNFDASKLPEAHGQCLRVFLMAVLDGCSLIVVDNTNISTTEISPYMAIAAAYGYAAEIVTIDCPLDVALQRQTHNVPEQTMRRMSARYESEAQAFPPWWKHTAVDYTDVENV
jgi:predicted kinase